MREDWDRRAREDAHYYVAFGRRQQEEEEFQHTAAEVVRNLEREMRRFSSLPAAPRALEIGCGPGRLMLPLSARCSEIHGVDVSEQMIRFAEKRLAFVPNAHVWVNSGDDLAAFPSESFDFVYSYAVFQHIPSLEVVLSYLRESRRVLKPGGFMRCQLNGLPPSPGIYDTWHGVRISAATLREFALANDFQLLALEGANTQYLWTTLAKRPQGWHAGLRERRPPWPCAVIRRITSAFSAEPLAPNEGRYACVSLWVEDLPAECDLLHMNLDLDGLPARPLYIGPPERDGLSQVNAELPAGLETGLRPVRMSWLGQQLTPPATLRVVPPGPRVPRVVAVSDAVDLLAGCAIRSGIVKLVLEEVVQVDEVIVLLDDQRMIRTETFCVDPLPMRHEMNVHLPETLPPGTHRLEVLLDRRRLGVFSLVTM
jgi:ubiquinone/menaquinone biosynthesis C-methylase UbiE